jgi:hypothetical protein
VIDPAYSVPKISTEKEIVDYKIVGAGFEGCKESIAVACSDVLASCHARAAAASIRGESFLRECSCKTDQGGFESDGICALTIFAEGETELGAICTLNSWVSCTDKKRLNGRWVPINYF